jgi:hypothetical protein
MVPAADVDARAQQIAQQNAFQERVASTDVEGRQAFPDWDTKVRSLHGLIDTSNQSEVFAYNQLVDAAIATGVGPKVIHELSGNLNEAMRLLGLPPVRMAVELTKMSQKLETAAANSDGAISNAPAPLRTTVGNRGVSHERISPDDPDRADGLDLSTWMARRAQQVKERGLR